MIHVRRDLTIEELWEELKDCFKALYIKCLAIKKDREWLSVMVTGFLSRKDKDVLENIVKGEYNQLERLGVTKLNDLLITYDILEANDFLKIVKSLSSGSINFRGQNIKLGENLRSSIETYSHLIPEEHEFPKVNLVISPKVNSGVSGTKIWSEEKIFKIEEELKVFEYNPFDELGHRWLRLTPKIRSCSFNAIIDIPIYFLSLPLELDLDKKAVIIKAMCHKALASKLRARLTLRKSFLGGEHYIPVEDHIIECPIPSEEINTLTITQPLESTLNKDDIIDCIITSKIGILYKKGWVVKDLLQKEISVEDFKLITQFVNLEEMRKLLTTEEALVGDKVKEPQLSFQRAVAWLLSILGFQTVELEGTKYKEMAEKNGTRRETDMLIFDPEKKDMYIVDITLMVPKDEKIDDIANLQLSLQRRGIMVKPIIITRDYARETKKNRRDVKVIDREDLANIISMLQKGDIQNAKRTITG